MELLTKDWRSQAKRKLPLRVTIETLGADILVKPMAAGRLFEIEQRFPTDDETGRICDYPAYMRAVIADSVVAGAGNEPLWSEEDIAKDLDTEAFWEIWEAVSGFLGLKKKKGEPAKN